MRIRHKAQMQMQTTHARNNTFYWLRLSDCLGQNKVNDWLTHESSGWKMVYHIYSALYSIGYRHDYPDPTGAIIYLI